MRFPYLEHANITVRDVGEISRMLLTALPEWRVRGEGRMQLGGRRVNWRHIGADDCYLALQDGGAGAHPDWRTGDLGMKHLGVVVPSLDEVLARLASVGYGVDHWGGSHPARRSAYVASREGMQIEFVEYLSESPDERNDYSR